MILVVISYALLLGFSPLIGFLKHPCFAVLSVVVCNNSHPLHSAMVISFQIACIVPDELVAVSVILAVVVVIFSFFCESHSTHM